MKTMTQLISILTGTDPHSGMYIDALSKETDSGMEVAIDIERISFLNDYGSAFIVPNGENAVDIEVSNLYGSKITIADPYSALNFALYRLNVRLDVEDEDILRVLPTGYPVLPLPECAFADHSAKAFTKEQMLEYARDAVARFTGMSPADIEADPVEFDDMYQDNGQQFCDDCGGMIGDDCSCESEEEDDEEDEEWEHSDCDRCGCDPDTCDCDFEADPICKHCRSASCQCLPD